MFYNKAKAAFIRKLHPSLYKYFDSVLIDSSIEALAKEKGNDALAMFDTLLDPIEMYHLPDRSQTVPIPIICIMHLSDKYEYGILRVIDDVCSAFSHFSEWSTLRENRWLYLPLNWHENREEIETNNYLRSALMNLLTTRVMDYCEENCFQIFEYTRRRAEERWKKIRQFARSRTIVYYWFELSQRKHHLRNGIYWRNDLIQFNADFCS